MQTTANPTPQAIYPALPYKRPVKYVAAPKRMIIAIRTTMVPLPPSIRSIVPTPTGCTIAIVHLPFISIRCPAGPRHKRKLSAYERGQKPAGPTGLTARSVPRHLSRLPLAYHLRIVPESGFRFTRKNAEIKHSKQMAGAFLLINMLSKQVT
jgi:hypothetical protein